MLFLAYSDVICVFNTSVPHCLSLQKGEYVYKCETSFKDTAIKVIKPLAHDT
jgi:hypothetical protein